MRRRCRINVDIESGLRKETEGENEREKPLIVLMNGYGVKSEMKKVTDPLDERARARLCGGADRWLAGYASSGSEHEADSECLSGLIHGFIEADEGVVDAREEKAELSSDSDFSDGDSSDFLEEILRTQDPLRTTILSLVSEMIAETNGDRPAVCRAVMARLRQAGFNAGVCKVKWESSGRVAAGSYEYVDVVLPEGDWRYIIDVDFAGEFEIARPTRQYSRFLNSLPRILVGWQEDLRKIIAVGSELAKKSMKARGLHVPPWRKISYMQEKWLGPYRRTTNPVSAPSPNPEASSFVNRRHVVGFDAGKCRPASPFKSPLAGLPSLKVAPL